MFQKLYQSIIKAKSYQNTYKWLKSLEAFVNRPCNYMIQRKEIKPVWVPNIKVANLAFRKIPKHGQQNDFMWIDECTI